MKDPQYMGDGVYAHLDELNRLVLTTGHHEPSQADNVIVLESEPLETIGLYCKRHNLKIS